MNIDNESSGETDGYMYIEESGSEIKVDTPSDKDSSDSDAPKKVLVEDTKSFIYFFNNIIFFSFIYTCVYVFSKKVLQVKKVNFFLYF